MAAELGNTGHPMVDLLQGVQLMANTYDDPDRKIEYVKSSLTKIGAFSLQGEGLYLATSGLWIIEPTPAKAYRYYNHSFVLSADVDNLTYMYDEQVPVDNLVLRFHSPDVLNIRPEHEIPFQDRFVSVPVLSIDACRAYAA